MPSIAEFAAKRTRKTKNCQKGYGCGNACINKQRKCKKKFSDQAATYAGWLKKNGGGTKSKDINSAIEAIAKMDIHDRSKFYQKKIDDITKDKSYPSQIKQLNELEIEVNSIASSTGQVLGNTASKIARARRDAKRKIKER